MSSLTTFSEISDGVLEVIAVPGHERDEHVPAEGEFAMLGVRAVGDDVALVDVGPS